MFKKSLSAGLLASALMIASASGAVAQEVTLKLQHFLPPTGVTPKFFFEPWAKRVEDQSNGRIKVEIYPSMQLGGKPTALFDQIKDGVVDLGWTIAGYTPGRFPSVEVFELPFMMTDAAATSKALNEYAKKHSTGDFKDVQLIALNVHSPGAIHSKSGPIQSLDDMKGKKVRGPTRIINQMLKKLGATPVGMPLPTVPQALSKGVIDATSIPWEVTPGFKVAELVKDHTDFAGDRALYTAVLVFAMNKAKYESLPDDLKAVIDNNSGGDVGAMMGQVVTDADEPARDIARKNGNKITIVDGDELVRWKAVGAEMESEWVAEMTAKGRAGQAMLDDAKALIKKFSE